MVNKENIFSYQLNPEYSTSIAYFSMEFAVDQSLKIYSGGLGFLAGSHLRSAYQLKQNVLGVGILWKYGYYDQIRNRDAQMEPHYTAKEYSFLKDTGIIFQVQVHGAPVNVKAYLLEPDTFKSAPLLLLSTDIESNDEISRTITHRLYDPNEATRIAQSIILGIGGAMLLDQLNLTPDIYHMNEGHSVALNFYLYSKFRSVDLVRQHVVFTTHTPELAGNEEHAYSLLKEMSFFYHLQDHEVKYILELEGDTFNYTLAALKFAKRANAVSKLHGKVAREMWNGNKNICEIVSITNAQNASYWQDRQLRGYLFNGENHLIEKRKKELKKELFKVVADQCGKIFNEDVLTIVWARRFAGYKRADLVMYDWQRFLNVINNINHPIQFIWGGKPYPEDDGAIQLFNSIGKRIKSFANCAVLIGYELELSALLKKGSDVWLNNPKMYREASGTSGMTAAMNGSVNLSIPDGWIPEFISDQHNAFVIQPAPDTTGDSNIDAVESSNLMDVIEHKILPMYYDRPSEWVTIMKNAALDVAPQFESARMAGEYYRELYNS